MVQMCHNDDKKEKNHSHTVYFKLTGNDDCKCFYDGDIYDLSLAHAAAYGSTKEKAIENMQEIIDWMFKEIESIKILYESGYYEDNMIDVDGFGNEIKHGSEC